MWYRLNGNNSRCEQSLSTSMLPDARNIQCFSLTPFRATGVLLLNIEQLPQA